MDEDCHFNWFEVTENEPAYGKRESSSSETLAESLLRTDGFNLYSIPGKVGDQILRVNGFPISCGVHHEVLAIMKQGTNLNLKVRSVGMLPVKERPGDPLTWKLVEEEEDEDHHNHHHGNGGGGYTSETDSSPSPHLPPMINNHSPHLNHHNHPTEAKITIDLGPNNNGNGSGLGCCICKGPTERPGIYVQSTRSNGIAREAGLRPGDQLLSCNGHSFLNVPFAQAVSYLKSSTQLRLRVLKGAAADLFPGESSGYNSSASSLNGDQGPPQGTNPSTNNTHHNGKMALDPGMEWDEVEQVWGSAESKEGGNRSSRGRGTIIIEVKGEQHHHQGALNNNNNNEGSSSSSSSSSQSQSKFLLEERKKLEETERRLREEALELELEKKKLEEEKRKLQALKEQEGNKRQNETMTSNPMEPSASSSLKGALALEIMKRHENKSNKRDEEGEVLEGEESRPKPGTVEQKRSLFNSQIDQEKRQQHEQLIEEFKRAHRKMFARSGGEDTTGGSPPPPPLPKGKRVQKELDHERRMVAQTVVGMVRQRQVRIERQHQECEETERELRAKSPPPPPPPPPPNNSNNSSKKYQAPQPPRDLPSPHDKKQKAPPPPPPARGGGPSNNNDPADPEPPTPTTSNTRPESPSPDYSNSPSPTPTMRKKVSSGVGGVEMESIESYRLKEPQNSGKNRKPPSVYFNNKEQRKESSGSAGGGNNGILNNGNGILVGVASTSSQPPQPQQPRKIHCVSFGIR